MLPMILEKHKTCLNMITTDSSLIQSYQKNNEEFAMERRFVIELHPSFYNVKSLNNTPLKQF